MRYDCDACCRESVGCDWWRAYWSCAEVSDWVAHARSLQCVIHGVVVELFFLFCFVLCEGGRDLLRCGGRLRR